MIALPVTRFLIVLLAACVLSPSRTLAADAPKPNVIFILCDDLGFGDVGVFYQNSRPADKASFQTPNIDALAQNGLMLTHHYSAAPVCAPARASLITGQDQGHANVRNNQFDKPIAPGPTLGSVMQAAGYYTGAIGKWGIGGTGAPFAAHPLDRGFNEFYGFMRHGAAHEHYPGNTGTIYDGRQPVTSGLKGAYSTDLFTARAKKFITDHVSSQPAQPFFLYLAYTAPHVKMEVPSEPYPSGGGLHGGIQWPLNTTGGKRDSYIFPGYASQKSWSPAARHYATMIRRIDDGVGDIVQLLRDLDLDKNTVIIFTSDNGPSNESDGGRYSSDPRYFDSWGPLDGIKRDLWDGGFREPTIVWAPSLVPPGRTSAFPSAFWDWMPTLAQLGGLPSPATSDGLSLLSLLEGTGAPPAHDHLYFEYFYDGSFGIDGGPDGLFARKQVSKRRQMQAIRIGDFMGVRYDITSDDSPMRLYNVVLDPHEDHNLADDSQYAGLLQQMWDGLKQSHAANDSAPRPYDGDLVPAARAQTAPGLAYSTYKGAWPWVPDFNGLTPASTGTVTFPDLSVRPAADNFGASFTGYVNAPADGDYTFYLKADSGALLRIHDMVVIDDASVPSGGVEQSGLAHLKAGLHPIRLYYRHQTGTAALDFAWSGPGFARRPLKAGDLRVDSGTAPAKSQ
jgi:arylsulfatase A-like enzyme